jgi:hypothetical protein
MVEATRTKPVAVFRVLDRDGCPIGEVVQPICRPVLGCGARTVLLVRETGRDRPPSRACA